MFCLYSNRFSNLSTPRIFLSIDFSTLHWFIWGVQDLQHNWTSLFPLIMKNGAFFISHTWNQSVYPTCYIFLSLTLVGGMLYVQAPSYFLDPHYISKYMLILGFPQALTGSTQVPEGRLSIFWAMELSLQSNKFNVKLLVAREKSIGCSRKLRFVEHKKLTYLDGFRHEVSSNTNSALGVLFYVEKDHFKWVSILQDASLKVFIRDFGKRFPGIWYQVKLLF